MTAVIECKVCGHTGHATLHQTGGGKWTAEVEGRSIAKTCQVPVQMRLPNNPGQIIAMPCGCDGQGPALEKPVPEKLPELQRCFNPGCQEFALLSSSFCSEECKMEMAALISGDIRSPQKTPDDEWMDL